MNSHKLLRFSRVAVCTALMLLNTLASSGMPIPQSKKPTRASSITQAFNLADFEPAGDGVTDDGPAFQSALDALAEAGGGTLFVPAGLYLIATPVVEDFSGADSVTIQGVPSDTMPAPPTAEGDQLSASLDLASEIIPATGSVDNAFTLSHARQLMVEHLAFTGRESTVTDAYVTLHLSDITQATIHHCEFYGISTFGLVAGQGGGNVVRAVRSDLSIEQTVVLGCTANSGAYAPIVENVEWKGFSISNSIFIDYGQRSFYGKMGLGAPLSWINIAGASPKTPESSRRQVVIRDTFFDEGSWIGITAFPHLWGTPVQPIDLIYISGIKMNVSNMGTAGNQFYDVGNVLIENSHYGWSRNTGAAVDIHRSENVILDQLTCIEDADRIRVDDRTDRLTVINSAFGGLDSSAPTTTVLETAPDKDPVQYVRQQFLSLLGRQPDPASHFYWSDLLLRCGTDQKCLDAKNTELREYLEKGPQTDFSLAGTVTDENGNPISGATLSLTGSQFATAVTDAIGNFQFSALPTSGGYTVTVSDRHHTFTTISQTFERPPRDISVAFTGRLNRHSIAGRITKADGSGASGVSIKLAQSSPVTTTTDADGNYLFSDLPAGESYTVLPSSNDFVFFPANTTIVDLSANNSANFAMRRQPELLMIENSDNALLLDSVIFRSQPFSIFDSLGFSNDGINRVMVFAKNLEGISERSLFSVVAEDDKGQTYPLEIEFVGDVSGQSWLKQINVKLSPELSGKCVRLKLLAGAVTSNTARTCLAEG